MHAVDLQPNWAEQVRRVTCPCVNPACGYEWVRGAEALTLGELLMVMGQKLATKKYAF